MSEVITIESKEDLRAILDDWTMVVVKFTAPAWCVPCRNFAPHFERAAGEANGVKFVSVDIDSNPWATVDYGVRSVPTVFLYEYGQYVRTIPSPQSAISFIRDLNS